MLDYIYRDLIQEISILLLLLRRNTRNPKLPLSDDLRSPKAGASRDLEIRGRAP